MNVKIPFRLGVQQRVLPPYRIAFFEMLAHACEGGLEVFAGLPRPDEALGANGKLMTARLVTADNVHIGAGRLYACMQRNFIDWLEESQPDVLVVEANPRYLSTPSAVRWMHGRGRPVIGWGLGAPPVTEFWRKTFRERFLLKFDALLVYGETGADQYCRAGFPCEKILVAPNAVAPRPTHPPAERPDEFAGGKASIIFVGRLQERKRVDLLLRSCANLPEAIQPELTIVGEGPERAELEALARQFYPRAKFIGEKRGMELQPYWEAADLFVLPGTGGLAIQEAMASGLPVIVAEGDGTQSDLVLPENGWLVQPGSEQALTDCLKTALQNPKVLREMGRASYRIVADEINLEEMVAGFARAVALVSRR